VSDWQDTRKERGVRDDSDRATRTGIADESRPEWRRTGVRGRRRGLSWVRKVSRCLGIDLAV
jgi:hypothetical protein